MIILYGLLAVVYIAGIFILAEIWTDFDGSNTRQIAGGICLLLWGIMFPAVVVQCIGINTFSMY